MGYNAICRQCSSQTVLRFSFLPANKHQKICMTLSADSIASVQTVQRYCYVNCIMCRVLSETGHNACKRKVSSQISLCSPHRLIRDDTFRTCIKPGFSLEQETSNVNEKLHIHKRKLSSLISLWGIIRHQWGYSLYCHTEKAYTQSDPRSFKYAVFLKQAQCRGIIRIQSR